MIKRFTLMAVVIHVFTVGAQGQVNKQRVDLLQRALKQCITPQDSMQATYGLGLAYIDAQYDSCFQYATLSFKLAKYLGDSVALVKSGRVVGQALWKLDRVGKSIDVLAYVLPVARRHKNLEEYKKIINILGLAYAVVGKYDKALTYHFESLKMVERSGDKKDMSSTLHNIGFVYYKLANYTKAVEYYERSIQLKKETGNLLDLDIALFNLSLCFTHKKELDKAKKYLGQALLTCTQNCKYEFYIHAQFGQGVIAYQSGEFSASENHFLKSYSLAVKSFNGRYQLENIVYLTRIAMQRRDYVRAQGYLLKAEEIDSRLSYNVLQIEIYSLFSELYNALKDYKKATAYQSKYIQLRDSIYSEELTQNLMVVQAEFAERENSTKIKSQNKVLLLKEQAIQRQYWLTFLSGVAVVLLIAIVAVLYRASRRKKKVNAILEEKVKQRSIQLASNAKALEEAYQEQRLFIAKTSEEIKTPLATLKDLCALATKEAGTGEAQQYIQQLNLTTENLSDAIDRLSDKINS